MNSVRWCRVAPVGAVLASLVSAAPALACPVSQQDEHGHCPDECDEHGHCPDDPASIEEEKEKKAEAARQAARARALAALVDGSSLRSIPATGPQGYSMGSAEGVGYSDEGPQHPVVLSGFLAMEHEVTQGEWAALMGAVPSGQGATGDRVPVGNVSWCDAVVFANRLTAKANEAGAGLRVAYTLPAGMDIGLTLDRCKELAPQVKRVSGANGFRLPTEAEWEYLARGGKGDTYVYAGSNTATEVGWVNENSRGRPHEVCTAPTPRNGFGLCDLTGNVWEWTGDWYDAAYYGTAAAKGPDPTGPESGSQRVDRGGGWGGAASGARVAGRDWNSPGHRYYYLGVRLVRSSP